MKQQIDIAIRINASPAMVWNTLIDPDLMKQWMGEPEMYLEIITDWKPGSPIVIKGFHHVNFVNTGTVLGFEPEKILRYNYLSSISRLPDKPENHTIVEFRLTPERDQTLLTLNLSNFPTESIFKHVDFYWRNTMGIIKDSIEREGKTN